MTFLMAVAQVQQPSVLDAFRQKALTECLSVEYEYSTVISGLKAVGAGTVEVQGNTYHMKGNGLEVFCNGESIWTIDEAAKEVVIDPCDAVTDAYVANPLLLLADLDSYFDITSQKRIGGNTEYVLHAIKDCGISQAQILLASDGCVQTGKFTLEDGSIVTVKVISTKKAEENGRSGYGSDYGCSS